MPRYLVPPTYPDHTPPPPPSPQDAGIPDEAWGARLAFKGLPPGEELDADARRASALANATRAAELQNQFLERQRQILHTGPDAFLARQGRDALLGADDTLAQLEAARQDNLAQAANAVQRRLLQQALGEHRIAEYAAVGDHVGRQTLAWQHATATERLNQLRRQAAVDYADPDALAAYQQASEGAARERARTSGFAPDSDEAQAEVDAGRSSIWRSAIGAALDKQDLKPALALYDKSLARLTPSDATLLQPLIGAAKERQRGQDYLANLAIPDTQDLAALKVAHEAATAQNAADWPDDESQRATNQHFIDTAFGQKKRGAIHARDALDQAVTDWLNQPGSDGQPQIERPPLAIWTHLSPEERRAVDAVLGSNASGTQARGADGNIILAQSDPEDPEYEFKRRFHSETPEEDEQHGRAPPPREIIPPPPAGLPLFGPRGASDPTPQSKPELSKQLEIGIGLGPYAGESIPARSRDRNFNAAERADTNRIGRTTGCHTCGTTDPGTSSGDFVLDHQPPSRLSPSGALQRLYPQCRRCSLRQGGLISQKVQREKK